MSFQNVKSSVVIVTAFGPGIDDKKERNHLGEALGSPRTTTKIGVPKALREMFLGARPGVQETLDDPYAGILRGQERLGLKPGVSATPEMRRGVGALGSALGQAEPLSRAGGEQQLGTISGQYLDPTQTPAWQELTRALNVTGQGTFQDLMDRARQGAARSGTFRSSAREAQEASAAQKVSSDIADTLARGGLAQYGAERGFQEGAAGAGLQRFPDIAGQLFSAGDVLARLPLADLQSRISAAMASGALDQRGLDALQQIIGMSAPRTESRPTALQATLQGIGGFLKPDLGGGGGGGGGGLASIFGGGG